MRISAVSISNFPCSVPHRLRMPGWNKKKYQILLSLNLFPSELHLDNAWVSHDVPFSAIWQLPVFAVDEKGNCECDCTFLYGICHLKLTRIVSGKYLRFSGRRSNVSYPDPLLNNKEISQSLGKIFRYIWYNYLYKVITFSVFLVRY